MKLCKKLCLCVMMVAAVLLCLFVMPTEAEAADVNDLRFTLNDTNDSYTLSRCDQGASGELVIPDTYNGLPVTKIGGYAFVRCINLTSVTIPNSVTTIGTHAFEHCTNLVSITLPDSVTDIHYEAFYEYSVKELIIAEGSTNISSEIVICKDTLEKVVIPASVTSIARSAFINCNSLTGVYIADLEAWCNIDFNSLHSSPTMYAQKLYLNDQLVTNLIIPDDITSVSDYAFMGCDSITSIAIPENITSIGSYAFSGCNNLETVIYCGTQAQWEAVTILDYNETITSAALQLHNMENNTCTLCGFGQKIIGDIDGSKEVNYQDAVYLLLHYLFGEDVYSLNGADGDIDGNETVDHQDAIYLLLHVMFGEENYPLKS